MSVNECKVKITMATLITMGVGVWCVAGRAVRLLCAAFGLAWLCLWSVDLCVVLGGGEDVREVAKMYIVYI